MVSRLVLIRFCARSACSVISIRAEKVTASEEWERELLEGGEEDRWW